MDYLELIKDCRTDFFTSALSAWSRIDAMNPLQRNKIPSLKNGVLSMTINYIRVIGYISAAPNSIEYTFIVITPRPTLNWSCST